MNLEDTVPCQKAGMGSPHLSAWLCTRPSVGTSRDWWAVGTGGEQGRLWSDREGPRVCVRVWQQCSVGIQLRVDCKPLSCVMSGVRWPRCDSLALTAAPARTSSACPEDVLRLAESSSPGPSVSHQELAATVERSLCDLASGKNVGP